MVKMFANPSNHVSKRCSKTSSKKLLFSYFLKPFVQPTHFGFSTHWFSQVWWRQQLRAARSASLAKKRNSGKAEEVFEEGAPQAPKKFRCFFFFFGMFLSKKWESFDIYVLRDEF